MSKLNVNIIASSSAGNAIVINDGVSSLLLDAGLSYRKLSRSVKLSDIEAVLITHEHGDHSKAVVELIRRGSNVCMSRGTAGELVKRSNQTLIYTSLFNLKQYETENWYILPFDVVHDAAEPLGFLCESKNSGAKVVYIVDSSIIEYDFSGVSHWIVEANYDDEILENGSYDDWLKNRIRKSHFSLAGLKTFLSTSDLSRTEAIYLVHLSDSNSHEQRFIREIEAITGVPTYCT